MLRPLLVRFASLFAISFSVAFGVQAWVTSLFSPSVYLILYSSVAIILVVVDGFTATELSGISLGESSFLPSVRRRFVDEASLLRFGILVDGAVLAILAAAGYSFASSVNAVSADAPRRLMFSCIFGVGVLLIDLAIRVLVRLSDVREFAMKARRSAEEAEAAARRARAIDVLRGGASASAERGHAPAGS